MSIRDRLFAIPAASSRTPLDRVLEDYCAHVRAVTTPKSAQNDLYYLRQIFDPVCDALLVLRSEEAVWLTADDVDLKAGMIRIRAKTVSGEFWEAETKRNRRVPISQALLEFGPRSARFIAFRLLVAALLHLRLRSASSASDSINLSTRKFFLFDSGPSPDQRPFAKRIGRELGVHRDTVARYVRLRKAAPPENVPRGRFERECLADRRIVPASTGYGHDVFSGNGVRFKTSRTSTPFSVA